MHARKPYLNIHETPDDVAREVADQFMETARQAIAERNRFTVAVSGGTTPKKLFHRLCEPPYLDAVGWSQVFVFFTDERFVPHDHPDSNFRLVRENLLRQVPLPPANLFPMPVDCETPELGATRYAAMLESFFGASLPTFDLALLGMGADGHTASLFSGFSMGSEPVIAVHDSPKPPPTRLSLNYSALNHSRNLWFLVTGKDKADMVHTILTTPDTDLPAGRIHLSSGNAIWFLDRDASIRLPAI